MIAIDAFHLPGLAPADIARWHVFETPTHALRAPLLTADGLHRCMRRLHEAQRTVSRLPVDYIIDVIDRVARRLLDRADPLRTQIDEVLPALTGYSPAMITLIIDRMATDWQRAALERVVHAELDDAAVLDRFVPRGAREVMAVAPRMVAHVFAGNIPGVAVTSIVRALLVRAASLGKTAAGEPLLAPLFARAVAAEDAALGSALAVTYWPGGDAGIETTVFSSADAVVVYGGAAALASARRAAPTHVPVLDHGPRLSAGFVARDALAQNADRLASEIALAVATFDQQGCVSPHAVFVEDGAALTARALAAEVATALAELQQRLPRGALTPAESAAIRELRTRAEFGAGLELVSAPDAPFTVAYSDAVTFEPSCLQRSVIIHRVAGLEDALPLLAPHRALLQSAALAGDPDFAVPLAHTGFTRITSFARIPWPHPAEHHDGRGPLTELLTFVEHAR